MLEFQSNTKILVLTYTEWKRIISLLLRRIKTALSSEKKYSAKSAHSFHSVIRQWG